MPNALSQHRFQRGVTLVEILVTVVIISVGLLGVAALHVRSLQNGQDAHVRSQATAFAHDIIDRMRANPDIAKAGGYDIAINATTIPTSITNLARTDLITWRAELASALPNGIGSISRTPVAGQQVITVVIQWGERRDETGESTRSFTTTAEL